MMSTDFRPSQMEPLWSALLVTKSIEATSKRKQQVIFGWGYGHDRGGTQRYLTKIHSPVRNRSLISMIEKR